jgi:transposase-like protein
VLDILVTSRRDAKAATRFFHKLLKGLRFVPRALITDKLAAQYREEMNTRCTTLEPGPHRRLTHPPHSHILGLRTARHTPAAST